MSDIDEAQEVLKSVKNTRKIQEEAENEIQENILSSEKHPLITSRDTITSLLYNSKSYYRRGMSTQNARGMLAELMLKQVVKYWAEYNNIKINIISNVMLRKYPRSKDIKDTTQIDMVAITDKCILVFECKSYFGLLETDGNILVNDAGSSSNPWKQNENHIIALENNLKAKYGLSNLPTVHNIVFLFSMGKFIKWEEPKSEKEHLMVTNGSWALLNKIYENSKPINEDIRDKIIELCNSSIPNEQEEASHIIRLRYYNKK